MAEAGSAGSSKRPDVSPAQPRRAKTRRSAGKAAASEEAIRTQSRTLESLTEARTPLEEFFNSLRGGHDACQLSERHVGTQRHPQHGNHWPLVRSAPPGTRISGRYHAGQRRVSASLPGMPRCRKLGGTPNSTPVRPGQLGMEYFD